MHLDWVLTIRDQEYEFGRQENRACWGQWLSGHIDGDGVLAVWRESSRPCTLEANGSWGLGTPIGGAGGGALATLGMLARLGLGGRVGHGMQGMSWIHEADLNRLFAKAITDESMSGVYIASAPNPVSQVDFMRTLRTVINMPIGLPAFEWMVRIGAPLLMRTDPELVLYGRYVVSKRLAEEGFEFQFPQLELALRNLYVRHD